MLRYRTTRSGLACGILVAVFASVIAGCGGRQVRTPPDSFLAGAPVETGDPDLDRRVARARETAALEPAEVQALRKVVAAEGRRESVETLVLHLVGRGDVDGALETLLTWTRGGGYREAPMASYLDLALGAGRLEECIQATDEFLGVHEEHNFLLLVRGLCLKKYGHPRAAAELYRSGMDGFEGLRGFTGVLERELGLVHQPDLPAVALQQDRLALMDYMTRTNVMGHVLVRHAIGMTAEDFAFDPRLIDLGGISSDEIARIFASRRDAFRHCQLMNKQGRKVPGGRLVLHLTIRRDGSPGDIDRLRDTFENTAVPACLEEQISNLWFPPPRYAKAVRYEHDFRMIAD